MLGPNRTNITTWDLANGGGYFNSIASGAWTTADTAVYQQITLSQAYRLDGFGWLNGGTVTGSTGVDVALYTSEGRFLAGVNNDNGGTKTQSGTSTWQTHSLATVKTIGAGRYWIGAVLSNNTSTFQGYALSAAGYGRAIGITQQASANPLPTGTTTFASLTVTMVPLVGILVTPLTGDVQPVSHGVINPWSWYSVGSGQIQRQGSLMGATSNAWPTANRALYVPVRIVEPTTFVKGFVYEGSTNGDKWDIGIFDAGGRKLVSSGATVHGASNAIVTSDITDTTLNPGQYFWAIQSTNAAQTFYRSAPAASVLDALGCRGETVTTALPAAASFGTVPISYMPIFGFTPDTVI